MQITEKQTNYIVYLISSEAEWGQSQTIKQIWADIPTHNEKYTDTRANYKKAILEDRLQVLSSAQASWIIMRLVNKRKLNKVVKIFMLNRII